MANEYTDFVDVYEYKDGYFYSANLKKRYKFRLYNKNMDAKKVGKIEIKTDKIKFIDALYRVPFLAYSRNIVEINRNNSEYLLYARNYYPIWFKRRARVIGTCIITNNQNASTTK